MLSSFDNFVERKKYMGKIGGEGREKNPSFTPEIFSISCAGAQEKEIGRQ